MENNNLVDKMKPLQIMYNIVMCKLNGEIPEDKYKSSFSLDNVDLEVLREAQKIIDMEKLKVTRYCLDKEDQKTYSELFKQMPSGPFPNPNRLLKLERHQTKMKDITHEIDLNELHQSSNCCIWEEHMLNQPEQVITTTNMSPEEMTIMFRKQPIQIQRFPTIVEAMEKVTQELNTDEEYYVAWKSAIAMAFKDEFWRTCTTHQDLDLMDEDTLHNIANTAADNFLKQLIR